MNRSFTLLCIVIVFLASCRSNNIAETEVITLIESTTSWNGDLLPDYLAGQAKVSILKYTIPPKTKLKMHKHPEINAGVLLKGKLTVVSEDNDTLWLEEGQALVELVNKWHFGMNEGSEPVEIIVFYAGIEGTPLVIPQKDSPNLRSLEQEVKKTLIKMWEAIENEDIDLYASFIHPDFTQFGENDSILRVGKKAEVQGIKEWIDNSSNIHTEMEEPRVVIRDSVAWLTYYWKDQGLTEGKPFSSRGKSTRIFVKENGKWLCIHGHYTLLPLQL